MPYEIGPIPMIYNAIKEGKSPTEALQEYRDAGGAIRTQRWYAAFGEVEHELAVRPGLQALPLNVVPGPEEITTRASSRPGAYNARGGVIVSTRSIDPESGKVIETTSINYGMLRFRNLMPYGELLSSLEGLFGPEGQSGTERSSVIGSFIDSVSELVEPQEIGEE